MRLFSGLYFVACIVASLFSAVARVVPVYLEASFSLIADVIRQALDAVVVDHTGKAPHDAFVTRARRHADFVGDGFVTA